MSESQTEGLGDLGAPETHRLQGTIRHHVTVPLPLCSTASLSRRPLAPECAPTKGEGHTVGGRRPQGLSKVANILWVSVGGRSWTPKGRELHLESDLGLVFSSANVSHGTLGGSFSASSSDYKMGKIISTLTTYSHEKHGGMPSSLRNQGELMEI